MSHQDPIFTITSSYYLNEMQSVISGRIDKFISIALFILGGSVMASFSNMFIIGAFISALSAIQIFCQFGKQSDASNDRAKKYLALMHDAPKLTEEEIHQKLGNLLQSDVFAFGALYNPAHKRAAIHLGLTDDTKLTKFESVMAWLAGDLPRDTPSDDTPHI